MHWVLHLPQPCCRELGSEAAWVTVVWPCAKLLLLSSLTGEAQSAEPRWPGPSSPCPHISLPLKGNEAQWDQPARVLGGGLGLCCHSECREPELGAATQLCPRVKQAGGTHSEGLLLGTGGWHNSSRQPSPDLERGGEGGVLGGKVSDAPCGVLELKPVVGGRNLNPLSRRNRSVLVLPLALSLAEGVMLPFLLPCLS